MHIVHPRLVHVGVVDQRKRLIVVVVMTSFRRQPPVRAMGLDRLIGGILQAFI